MANAAKRAGTDAENKVRDYAQQHGFPYARRLAQAGANDEGDIYLGDGIDFTIEVKGGQGSLSRPHQHLKELKAEIGNKGDFAGAAVVKKAGSTDVGEDWVAMMPVKVLFAILHRLYLLESIDQRTKHRVEHKS